MEGGRDELRFLGRITRMTVEGCEWERDDEDDKLPFRE